MGSTYGYQQLARPYSQGEFCLHTYSIEGIFPIDIYRAASKSACTELHHRQNVGTIYNGGWTCCRSEQRTGEYENILGPLLCASPGTPGYHNQTQILLVEQQL